MPQTQRLIIASFALIAGIGLGFFISQITTSKDPAVHVMPTITPLTSGDNETQFKQALLPRLLERFGTTSVGFEPQRLMYVYPGFVEKDFDKVEAMLGIYEYSDGFAWYYGGGVSDADSNDISDAGYITLYKNVAARMSLQANTPLNDVIKRLEEKVEETVVESPSTPTSDSPAQVACPADAKQCPDGSYVTRIGSTCEFAACPASNGGSNTSVICTPEQRQAEACIELYAPVCAAVQIQCVTTPCEPIPKTYPNSCFACAEERVISYTEGACQ